MRNREDAGGAGDDFTTLDTLPELAATTTLSDIQLGDIAGIAIQIVAPDGAAE